MITAAINRLEYLLDLLPAKLQAIADADFSHKPAGDKWSKKEIMGHLIDSAANNHHRFIRARYEENPELVYDQDQWNTFSHYHTMDKDQLLQFWELYNRHLLHLIRNIPGNELAKSCNTGHTVTLDWLIRDYVQHLEHHLAQILKY